MLAGKRVFAACAPNEVQPILKAVGPDGLLLSCACRSRAEAMALLVDVRAH